MGGVGDSLSAHWLYSNLKRILVRRLRECGWCGGDFASGISKNAKSPRINLESVRRVFCWGVQTYRGTRDQGTGSGARIRFRGVGVSEDTAKTPRNPRSEAMCVNFDFCEIAGIFPQRKFHWNLKELFWASPKTIEQTKATLEVFKASSLSFSGNLIANRLPQKTAGLHSLRNSGAAIPSRCRC